MSGNILKPVSLLLALVLTVSAAALVSGSAQAQREDAARSSARTVANTNQGTLDSKVFGRTGNDRKVRGSFVPLEFVRKDGKVKVRGLIQGVIVNENGGRSTFSAMRTLRVVEINGVSTAGRTAAGTGQACDILNLVLGPLDLDLLGLEIHLNRVVLDIVAQSGAGKLLGNLLCAVAGLLDGGLDGVLGRLTRLLNRILGALRLGV